MKRIQIYSLVYLSFNSLFVIPIIILSFFHSNINPEIYIYIISLYYIYKIVHFQIFFCLLLLILYIYNFVQNKSKKTFEVSLLLCIQNILLNILWVILGQGWTVV